MTDLDGLPVLISVRKAAEVLGGVDDVREADRDPPPHTRADEAVDTNCIAFELSSNHASRSW
jgi:hypothetical protein